METSALGRIFGEVGHGAPADERVAVVERLDVALRRRNVIERGEPFLSDLRTKYSSETEEDVQLRLVNSPWQS